jgi:hypothetical protein
MERSVSCSSSDHFKVVSTYLPRTPDSLFSPHSQLHHDHRPWKLQRWLRGGPLESRLAFFPPAPHRAPATYLLPWPHRVSPSLPLCSGTGAICKSQESKLALLWTVGIFALNCGPVIMGFLLDYAGPKVTMIVGAATPSPASSAPQPPSWSFFFVLQRF